MATDRHRIQVGQSELVAQLRTLGVRAGGVLVVHTSFRVVRPVEDGPLGLIQALREALGPDGTLVMPAWPDDDNAPFDPVSTAASEDLGVVADTFWRQPGVVRSRHVNAFAAYGPHAQEINADEFPLPPHIPESPIGRVYDLNGQVLLLGVGHEANTTLHLAELIADVPYRIPRSVTVFEAGQARQIEYGENDHCCELFRLADDWLRERGLQTEGPVGYGHARLMHSRNVVGVALEHLSRDPLVFLHLPSAGCEACDQARASIRG
jgi:aminoglycoside N3'-acetyltransferase